MGRRMGRLSRKAKRRDAQRDEEESVKKAPHSFVIHRGKVGRSVMSLTLDFRRVMSPYTAENLKVMKRNVLKDFIAIAGPMNVTHLVMFSKSDVSVNMRICRLPRGPTLHFQVQSYSLIHDLAHHIRKHDVNASHFRYHALLVLNNFSKDVNHLKLAASMFQNMFPSININQVRLRNIRRVLLVHYDEQTDTIELRHYHLRAVPLGISKSVKKLSKKVLPRLDKYHDISQFILNPGALSESEAELDGEHNSVELPQRVCGLGNTANHQSAIRLKEIGPRMTLVLTKITEGINDGDVLYYKYDTLTDAEKAKIKKRREEKRQLKAQRTAEQNERVRLKKLAKEEERERSRQQQQRQQAQKSSKLIMEGADMLDSDEYESALAGDGEDAASDVDMADSEYYEQEVGSKPDKEMFSGDKSMKRPMSKYQRDGKGVKRKFNGRPPSDKGKPATKRAVGKAVRGGKSRRPQPATGSRPFTGGVKATGSRAKAKPKANVTHKRKGGK